eukprot:m.1638417 g.1638417  ORF g.1638417 m.1638417 type:complete len:202 (-) comp27951_c0_seq1:141-746(-)
MPLLLLSKEHKEHLSFLSTVDEEAVTEFGKLAMDFVLKGVNPKVYNAASKKLGVDADSVQHAVEGIMFLLTESSKMNMSDMDFNDSVMILGFADQLHQQLMEVYKEHMDTVRRITGEMAMTLPQYKDMKWRIDAQIASRTLRQQNDPSVVIHLDTIDVNADPKAIVLQTDPATLARVTSQLEAALKAVKSSHYRRITRAIK